MYKCIEIDDLVESLLQKKLEKTPFLQLILVNFLGNYMVDLQSTKNSMKPNLYVGR